MVAYAVPTANWQVTYRVVLPGHKGSPAPDSHLLESRFAQVRSATLPTLWLLAELGCSSARARAAVERPGGLERVRRSFHSPSAAHGGGSVWRNWVDTVRLGDDMQLTPINTYHLRTTYSLERIARYTEWPLGLGYGRARLDEQGNRREVFGIVFQDSGARWQYNFGYMHVWNSSALRGNPDVVIGAGYMVFLMGRWDWNYFPIPIVLPVLSLGISRFSIETTFVPGWEGLGQLFFTWIQMRL